jgi:hypothetical protein
LIHFFVSNFEKICAEKKTIEVFEYTFSFPRGIEKSRNARNEDLQKRGIEARIEESRRRQEYIK